MTTPVETSSGTSVDSQVISSVEPSVIDQQEVPVAPADESSSPEIVTPGEAITPLQPEETVSSVTENSVSGSSSANP